MLLREKRYDVNLLPELFVAGVKYAENFVKPPEQMILEKLVTPCIPKCIMDDDFDKMPFKQMVVDIHHKYQLAHLKRRLANL